MDITFLLDEDTERDLAALLAGDGYDVERVVEVTELGPGADDDEVRAYARSTDRLIVTYDDHYISVPNSEHAGVFYAPAQETETYVLYQVIEEVLTYREGFSGVVFLSPDTWL
jgi:hypothetical protein